ncbi:Citrate synthase II [Sandaracinus amylolyticus]|nr:Citrate synthase II [Sandaracinus amylolyticus]
MLDTAISGIGEDGPHYRGRSAVELARSGTRFEIVAEWLWAERWDEDVRFEARDLGIDVRRAARLVAQGAHPLDRLLAGVALIGAAERGSHVEPGGEGTFVRARSLVRRLAALLALAPGEEDRVDEALAAPTIAHAVAIALGLRATKRAAAAIDRALVVMADHELNASTFTARVAAGAGADLHACVLAALATLTGPAHGGSCDRMEALLAEAREPEDAARILAERRRRGDALPGFGHPLYPSGDPRTPPLLDAAEELAPRSVVLRKVRAFTSAMGLAGGEPPTVDAGLVALAGALGAGPGSAAALMAIGRAAGWIAHAIEQREAGFQLRPRARYLPR